MSVCNTNKLSYDFTPSQRYFSCNYIERLYRVRTRSPKVKMRHTSKWWRSVTKLLRPDTSRQTAAGEPDIVVGDGGLKRAVVIDVAI